MAEKLGHLNLSLRETGRAAEGQVPTSNETLQAMISAIKEKLKSGQNGEIMISQNTQKELLEVAEFIGQKLGN